MTEGTATGPFAPLREDAAPSSAAPLPPDAWVPQVPAPVEPPEASAIRHGRHGAATTLWVYRDAEGRPLFAVVRFDPKNPDGTPKLRRDGKPEKKVLPYTFGTLRGRPGWQFRAAPKPRPLYGLNRLEARPDAPVVMVEGEKAADAAMALFPEHVAMTWPGGSNGIGKADCSPLAGRRVVVWGDNDELGRKAAAAVVTAR